MEIMKFQAQKVKGTMDEIAYPANEAAYLACLLVNRNFLKDDEVKIFQKLGFTIEIVQEKTNTTKE